MARPKKKLKKYKDTYRTEGQRVTGDGKSIIMPNGHQYKRIVLPSIAERKETHLDEMLEEAIDDGEQSQEDS